MDDRFHVIRMIQHHFLEFCKQAQESIRWKRTIIHPLRKRDCNLTPREKQTLYKLKEMMGLLTYQAPPKMKKIGVTIRK